MDFRKKFYALTLSPPYSTRSIKYDYYQYLSQLKRSLNLVSQHYIIFPEISAQGRLHYHGVVRLDDPIKWFRQSKRRLERNIGFMKFDPIKSHLDHLRWLVYINKHWYITKEVIGLSEPLIYKKGTYFSKEVDEMGTSHNTLLDYGIEIDK